MRPRVRQECSNQKLDWDLEEKEFMKGKGRERQTGIPMCLKALRVAEESDTMTEQEQAEENKQ